MCIGFDQTFAVNNFMNAIEFTSFNLKPATFARYCNFVLDLF